VLDPDELVAAARSRTGLRDFGDPSFRTGLDVLTAAIEHDTRLRPGQDVLVRERLVGLLAERLRVEDWHRRRPEIADAPVTAPLWIVGLPRTGTTALSSLLAEDPDTRVLRTWESAAPTPPPLAGGDDDDPRIDHARAIIELTDSMAPHLKALYPTSATGPTEHQDLLGMAFCTNHFKGLVWIPSYERWLLSEADHEAAFRYHRRVLQLLQWRGGARRWMLKCPSDLLATDALLVVYPDARLIWTHRDPAAVLASVCTLICAYLELFCEGVDHAELGRRELSFWAEAARRATATRDRHPERFCDVHHADLAADPLAAVAGLYVEVGEPFTGSAREAMARWVSDHPRRRFGEPSYELTEWGLDADRVRATFAGYTQRFDVVTES
jgi:hypothetical protein